MQWEQWMNFGEISLAQLHKVKANSREHLILLEITARRQAKEEAPPSPNTISIGSDQDCVPLQNSTFTSQSLNMISTPGTSPITLEKLFQMLLRGTFK